MENHYPMNFLYTKNFIIAGQKKNKYKQDILSFQLQALLEKDVYKRQFRGKAITKKDPSGNIGIVNISNIGDYEIDYAGLEHLQEEERKVFNYLLQEGDVLLPARGTAIRTAVFHSQSYPCIASSNLIVIRPDAKMLDSIYLKIFLDSPIGNKLISLSLIHILKE